MIGFGWRHSIWFGTYMLEFNVCMGNELHEMQRKLTMESGFGHFDNGHQLVPLMLLSAQKANVDYTYNSIILCRESKCRLYGIGFSTRH